MNRITDISLYEDMALDGDLDVSGALTANSFPFESLTNIDKQSFEGLVDNGDFRLWPAGDSSAPAGWTLGGGASIARESTIVKINSNSAKVTKAAGTGYLYTSIDDYARYKGREITVGVWIYCSDVDGAKIRISDGVNTVYGDFHTGGGGWELLTKTYTVNANATSISVYLGLYAAEGAVVYVDGFMTVEGSMCPAFSPKPISFIGWESLPPFLDENSANVANKPTLITRGLFGGYSLPEYAAGEELLFRMRVPHCWDGSSNPWFVCITSASAVEDIGDKYKFQLEWQAEDIESVIPDTTAETLTDEITLTDGSAFYANIAVFELNGSLLAAGENLQMRLRRIAASASSVTNEVIIWHWDTRWRMDKIGTESIQGY